MTKLSGNMINLLIRHGSLDIELWAKHGHRKHLEISNYTNEVLI